MSKNNSTTKNASKKQCTCKPQDGNCTMNFGTDENQCILGGLSRRDEIKILKKYAPQCKIEGCTKPCQIAWDNRGKILFDHCHDCHFEHIGEGFYISKVSYVSM